jgi:phage shock protein PspC (stress-responsive transcriptional regulator)
VNPRRLYRSRRDRRIAGVAGGVAEYLEVDPTVIRVLWIISIFFGGFGLLLYIIMAFIVPLEPMSGQMLGPTSSSAVPGWQAPASAAAPAPAAPAPTAPTAPAAPTTEATATSDSTDASGTAQAPSPDPTSDEATDR